MLPPELLLTNVILNSLMAFLLILERVEKYARRAKKIATRSNSREVADA